MSTHFQFVLSEILLIETLLGYLLGACLLCKVYQPNKLIHTYTNQGSFEPSYYLARKGPLTLKAVISSFGLLCASPIFVKLYSWVKVWVFLKSCKIVSMCLLPYHPCSYLHTHPHFLLSTNLLWADWKPKLSVYTRLSLVLRLVCSNINITEYFWVNESFNIYSFTIIFFVSGNKNNSLIDQFSNISNIRLVTASYL